VVAAWPWLAQYTPPPLPALAGGELLPTAMMRPRVLSAQDLGGKHAQLSFLEAEVLQALDVPS